MQVTSTRPLRSSPPRRGDRPHEQSTYARGCVYRAQRRAREAVLGRRPPPRAVLRGRARLEHHHVKRALGSARLAEAAPSPRAREIQPLVRLRRMRPRELRARRRIPPSPARPQRRSVSASASRVASAAASSIGTGAGRSYRERISGSPPTAVVTGTTPAAAPRQAPRVLDLAVRQADHAGAGERRGGLGVRDEPQVPRDP